MRLYMELMSQGLRSIMKEVQDEEEGPGRHTCRVIGIAIDRDNKVWS